MAENKEVIRAPNFLDDKQHHSMTSHRSIFLSGSAETSCGVSSWKVQWRHPIWASIRKIPFPIRRPEPTPQSVWIQLLNPSAFCKSETFLESPCLKFTNPGPQRSAMRNMVSILLVHVVRFNILFWKSKEWSIKPTESLPFNSYRRNFYGNFQIILTLLHTAAAAYDFTPV